MEHKPNVKNDIREARSEHTPPKRDQLSAIFGYILMSVAIVAFIFILINDELGKPSNFDYVEVPVLFFITMLGFVCIHPDLLKDAGKNLSTMRIVVFMMINVICMLMLKIGWSSANFAAIGMTGTWVTIIGFVFGGKVAQSYIESRASSADTTPVDTESPAPTNNPDPSDSNPDEQAGTSSATPINDPETTGASEPADPAEIAKMAADQNRQQLMSAHGNINSVSDTVANNNGEIINVVAIYLSDSNAEGIPSSLEAKLETGTQSIPTEIITNVGKPRIQLLQQNNITGTGITELGSVGAMVSSAIFGDFRGVVTSGHIYSNGDSTSVGRVLQGAERTAVQIAGADAGVWHFQLISTVQDLAIAQLNQDYVPGNYISFKSGGFYNVSNSDVLQTAVTLNSAMQKVRTGYILDYNIPQSLPYGDDVTIPFTNIILIGSTNNRSTSQPVSQDGDSGGAVYISDGTKNKLVGLILGSNEKYTFVLPIQDTLANWHFTLL